MSGEKHFIDECPQAPTINHIVHGVTKLEKISERTALALEKIAEQGALITSHDHRIEKLERDADECFARLRPIERIHAKEEGMEEVEAEGRKFWTDVKLKLLNPILLGIFFVFWAMDKYSGFQMLSKLWHAMMNGE